MAPRIEKNPYNNKAYSANYYTVRARAQKLPVSQSLPKLLDTIKNNKVTILVGETGSGKTTQLPKAILADSAITNGRMIAVTQNRRLAAQLVSARIAEELDVQLGEVVGVKYRGVDRVSRSTRLAILTDGSLLAAARADPSLSKYGVIIIDEAHLHTTATDLLLGILKGLLQTRDDLKIIIMSATIDTKIFAKYFPGAAVEEVEGRTFPVTEQYLPTAQRSSSAILRAAVNTVLMIHLTQRSGDILVFASGVREIFEIIAGIESSVNNSETAGFDGSEVGPLDCFPLSAQLSAEAQDLAVSAVARASSNGKIGRKVIVATNIAEASITLPGIVHVVDCCRVKEKIWNPRKESWALHELWVSKQQAKQRAGRAGRTRPGIVWRMCTQEQYQQMVPDQTTPAMLQGDMLSEILSNLSIGSNPIGFPFIAEPAPETMDTAFELLLGLNAIDYAKQALTPMGEAIAGIPTDVYSAVTLLVSSELRCSDEVVSLISLMDASDGGTRIFQQARSKQEKNQISQAREKFLHVTGDHLTLFNIYMAWRQACEDGAAEKFLWDNWLLGSVLRAADHTRQQLLMLLTRRKDWEVYSVKPTQMDYYTRILRALAAGSFLRAAKRDPKTGLYDSVRHGYPVSLSDETEFRDSSVDSTWVIYNEVSDKGVGAGKLRVVSAIAPEYLIQANPTYWSEVDLMPEGHIRDGLLEVMARMAPTWEGLTDEGMPKPAVPTSSA